MYNEILILRWRSKDMRPSVVHNCGSGFVGRLMLSLSASGIRELRAMARMIADTPGAARISTVLNVQLARVKFVTLAFALRFVLGGLRRQLMIARIERCIRVSHRPNEFPPAPAVTSRSDQKNGQFPAV
jgi:hypothetical protein